MHYKNLTFYTDGSEMREPGRGEGWGGLNPLTFCNSKTKEIFRLS